MGQYLAFRFTGDRRILAGARLGASQESPDFRIIRRFVIPPTESHLWGETPYLMTAFEQIGASGDVLGSGPGNAVWESFWKTDLEKWRADNKLIYGRKP